MQTRIPNENESFKIWNYTLTYGYFYTYSNISLIVYLISSNKKCYKTAIKHIKLVYMKCTFVLVNNNKLLVLITFLKIFKYLSTTDDTVEPEMLITLCTLPFENIQHISFWLLKYNTNQKNRRIILILFAQPKILLLLLNEVIKKMFLNMCIKCCFYTTFLTWQLIYFYSNIYQTACNCFKTYAFSNQYRYVYCYNLLTTPGMIRWLINSCLLPFLIYFFPVHYG